jgi:anti-sigma B factor antagonist
MARPRRAQADAPDGALTAVSPLAVQVDTIGTTTILRPFGVADIATAPSLGIQAADLIRRGDRDIVVDLSEVSFLDSTALSVLLNIARRATRAGLGSALICPDGRARLPIRIARLEETLRVRDTEREALRCVEELRARTAADEP